tara:strand:+ start:1768 stop:2163 length:396 start_codon:yes stop_codon:yes gene_type:complete
MTHIEVVCALIERDGKVLVAKRAAGGPTGGKWEFPGGKIKAGETSEQAVCREIVEELGCTIEPIRQLGANNHAYPEFSITLQPILCRIIRGEPVAIEHALIKWVSGDQMESLDWADADVPIAKSYRLSSDK